MISHFLVRELIELENSEVVCKDIGICTENNDDREIYQFKDSSCFICKNMLRMQFKNCKNHT